jgi:hypothetical protein
MASADDQGMWFKTWGEVHEGIKADLAAARAAHGLAYAEAALIRDSQVKPSRDVIDRVSDRLIETHLEVRRLEDLVEESDPRKGVTEPHGA